MKPILNILFLLVVLISFSQNDSIDNRYTDKFRLESFDILPVYLGFDDQSNIDQFNWNATFSIKRHLIQVGHLEFAFDDSNTENFAGEPLKNTYNLFHISYGYAQPLWKNFRTHYTIGLGQIRFEREAGESGSIDNTSINYRLASKLYYDINNQLAVAGLAGLNVNDIRTIPEIGVGLTLKIPTQQQIEVRRKKKEQWYKQKDSIAQVQSEEEHSNRFKFHAVQVTLSGGRTDYTKKTKDELIPEMRSDGSKSDGFSAGSISFQISGRFNKHLFGLSGSSALRWGFLSDPPSFSEFSVLYGRLFTINDAVAFEAYTGASYFTLRNVGVDKIKDETTIGLPVQLNAVFLRGNNKIGLGAHLNVNSLVTNYSIGITYARRF